MDFQKQALEMEQHSLQRRRQQAAVPAQAVKTFQEYHQMLCHQSFPSQESLRQQARVGSVRHRAANQKVLVLGLSLGKKMVRS